MKPNTFYRGVSSKLRQSARGHLAPRRKSHSLFCAVFENWFICQSGQKAVHHRPLRGALEFPCTFCRHHCCSSRTADRLTFDEGRCKRSRSRSALGKHIPRLEGLAHIYLLHWQIKFSVKIISLKTYLISSQLVGSVFLYGWAAPLIRVSMRR